MGVGDYNAALRARARSRDVAGTAEAWARLVANVEPNDRSFGILIDGFARVGDGDGALRALWEVPGGGNVVHFTSAILALSRSGRHGEAAALHERMVAEELARPNFQSFHGYLRALAGLARHGGAKNGDRALGALEAMNRTVGSVDARAYQTAVYVRGGAATPSRFDVRVSSATPSRFDVRVSSVGARRSKEASRW